MAGKNGKDGPGAPMGSNRGGTMALAGTVTPEVVRSAETIYGADFNTFLHDIAKGDINEARNLASARDTYLRSRQRELDLAVRTGNLVNTEVLVYIRNETIEAINNHLGPALHRSLTRYGVPEDEITKIREGFYNAIVDVWRRAAEEA